MRSPIGYLSALLLASCGGSGTTPAPAPVADGAAAHLVSLSKTREQALAFFHPLPAVVEHPAGPDTPEKVALGDKLFMDPQLSSDGTISCNSCHQLDKYGVDGTPTSTGVGGQVGKRNSPTVYNAALYNMQFWDGRAADVEEQAGMPVMNPVEMGIPAEDALVSKLKHIADYPPLFRKAFPADKDPLTYANIREAIGAFERTLLTPSRFDAFLKGDTTALTAREAEGLRTFMSVGCVACHSGVAMGGTMLQKFGVHADFRPLTGSSPDDQGRKDVTGAEGDKDLFKVSTLRNITKTAPYFHDGRVAELNKAIRIMGTVQLGKELSDQQVSDLKAFLEALTGVPPPTAKGSAATP